MFLHPSQLYDFALDHQIITEEGYLSLSKSVEDGQLGDIEKARRDLSHLMKVTSPVVRDGKIIMQTFYINPNKTDKSKFDQKNRKGSSDEIKYDSKDERVKFDGNLISRGDLVKIKLQDGTETVGQFRHFITAKGEDGKEKAIIRAQIKNRKGELVMKSIERNIDDVVVIDTKPKPTVEKKFDPNSFKVGDEVEITVRTKDKNSAGVTSEERKGVLARKIGYGYIVLLEDGTYVDRPLSTLRKHSEGKSDLTEQQQILLNKAIRRIKNSIQDKVNLIEVLEKRKPSNWEATTEKINKEIQSDKNMQYNYYQVFKGNLHFDDIIKTQE